MPAEADEHTLEAGELRFDIPPGISCFRAPEGCNRRGAARYDCSFPEPSVPSPLADSAVFGAPTEGYPNRSWWRVSLPRFFADFCSPFSGL